jgi:small subunit ribosomal protein S1
VENGASERGASEHGASGRAERRFDKKPATDRAPFHVGEEVFGKVTAVLDDAIMVDLSGKALGVFDRREMEADDLVPSEGDRFVARIHQDGARGGMIVLTRKPLREEEAKPAIEQASKDGTLIDGLITGVIKGGVDVDINGLRAFAPASGMDLHPQNANFASMLGQRLDFKVTRYDSNGRDVVVTRRPMLEAEAHERRKKAIKLLEEGKVMNGVVRTVVEWGVFVALPDAENLEGLVHATEASHDPRVRLLEAFKAGDKLEVKITKIDERGKIWLSRKALIADPWKEAKEKYPAGTRLKTTITRVERFGAFCQLEGVEGLLHVADLGVGRTEDINDQIKVGDEMDVVVHQFDLKNHKVALHPALTGDRAEEVPQKIARNGAVKVEVVKAESAGVVVRLLGATGRAARGFIPAGQTGTDRGTDLRKRFPVGQKLDVTVLDIDPRRGEPKLSIRRFAENEERSAHREYRKQLAAEGGFGTLGDLLRKQLDK